MTNGIGLYIHVPFCRHRCSYCDFFSLVEGFEFDRYAQSLLRELEQCGAWWRELGLSMQIDTVFFGGGTPSLLPLNLRIEILSAIRHIFSLNDSAELTLETNPENVTEDFLSGVITSGINRMSLGVQSFNQENLNRLDRKTSADSVRRALDLLTASEIKNWSLDLIMGIPGQGVSQLVVDLEKAKSYRPPHLSVYSLTLKPGHPLYSELPGEDLAADLFEAASETLGNAGYRQYEISNFALPGFECRHNLIYWNGGDFIGVGPSAASRYFLKSFHHRKQISDMKRYYSQGDVREVQFEAATITQSQLEATFLELRKDEGVNLKDFQNRYGVDLTKSPKFSRFVEGGFLEGALEKGFETIRLTKKGRLLADTVTAELV